MLRNIINRGRLIAVALCALWAVGFGGVAVAAAAPSLPHTVAASKLQQDACAGLSQAGGDCSSGGGSISGVVKAIVNVLTVVVGIAAVIVIIISGLRFVTSSGDAQKVAAARSGIIYAIVGLIIVALAQVIVRFVLSKA